MCASYSKELGREKQLYSSPADIAAIQQPVSKIATSERECVTGRKSVHWDSHLVSYSQKEQRDEHIEKSSSVASQATMV